MGIFIQKNLGYGNSKPLTSVSILLEHLFWDSQVNFFIKSVYLNLMEKQKSKMSRILGKLSSPSVKSLKGSQQ